VASGQNPDTNSNVNSSLSNFLNEFRQLITPILSLLTIVLDRLLVQNAK
jgi:hypothetical protein